MAVTRERDGDAAAEASAGSAAFWAGEPYRADRSGDWSAGWLAAAASARQRAKEAEALMDHAPRIADAMHQAYAAIRRVEGVSKLRPGDRSELNLAAVKLGALLPYVGPRQHGGASGPRGGGRTRPGVRRG